MKRFLPILLALTAFAYLAGIFYANRALYTSKFDQAYWQDKYEQSQWNLPLSVRTIGDDGLYLYEGWRLAHGGDPATVNAEMPPLGKYLIGGSILFFGNGYIYGLLSTLGLLVVFFVFVFLITKNTTISLTTTTLLALDPLLVSQFPLTMLDSLHALLFFLSLVCMIRFYQEKKPHIAWIIAGGMVMGLFSATKFPLLTPLILVFSVSMIWKKSNRPRWIIIFIITASLTYLSVYSRYFFLGHSLIDFLKLQKWMVSFYLHGTIKPNTGSILTTILFNRYQNLFSHSWENVKEWSFTWPISFMGTLVDRYRSLPRWVFMLLMIMLVLYTFIPFWTRYAIIILPFLYLGVVLAIQRMRWLSRLIIVYALFAINGLFTYTILFPTPDTAVRQFVYDWQYGFFQDMYEQLTNQAKASMDRQTFYRFGQRVLRDGQIEAANVDIKLAPFTRHLPLQYALIKITYHTRSLGSFTGAKVLPVVKEDGRWKIPWEWTYFISGLMQDRHLETIVTPAKRGSILASDKTELANDFDSFLVWVTPGKIDVKRENELLTLLRSLFLEKFTVTALHHRYAFNRLADWPVPIGIFPQPLPIDTYRRLIDFPGVSLSKAYGRQYQEFTLKPLGTVTNTNHFECCSLLYSTTSYDGISGVEKEKNALLKGENGGQLVIKDTNGKVVRTIISKEKRDGADVQP